MVDVGRKRPTRRTATASATVNISKPILDQVMSGGLVKGDALATARVAGMLAAKRTSEWIPLCHPLPLAWVAVEFERPGPDAVRILCTARTCAQTGVEMEAMTGAAVAALTLYDMVKAVDKSVEIGPIRLETKTGGKSGTYRRKAGR